MQNNTVAEYEEIVAEALAEIEQESANLAVSSEWDRSYLISQLLDRKRGSKAQALRAALNAEGSLGYLRNGWLQVGGTGQVIQDHMLTHLVLDWMAQGKPLSEFIEHARRFASERSAEMRTYLALIGVKVTTPIDIKPGLRLISWDDAPDSAQKRRLSSAGWNFNTLHPPTPPPSCAIELVGPRIQVLFASHEGIDPLEFAKVHRDFLNAADAHDLICCLIATMNVPITCLGSWTILDNPVGNGIGGAGFRYGGAPGSFHPNPSPPSQHMLHLLMSRFEKLNEPDKAALRIALRRLNQARRIENAVDRVIDLGIALETILLHGMDDDRGELSFRLAIRGATFIGRTNSRKRRNFKLLRDAYRLRSTAVHTGVLKSKQKPMETINKVLPLCTQIARRMIIRGCFPKKWEEEIVLA